LGTVTQNPHGRNAAMNAAMNANENVIRRFVAAWSDLDAARLVDFFTEDGTYHNMMLDPVSGRENLLGLIGGFLGSWTATEWDLLNIASNGNIVFAERLDRTRAGDKTCNLPCCGVFEMQDGKIKVWRDYFDIGTYMKAFA